MVLLEDSNFCNLQRVTLLCVLRCIVELVDGTAARVLHRTSSCVAVVCDHLCAHISPIHLSLFLHVLQVLRAGSGPSHTSHIGCSRTLSWNTLPGHGRLPLLLHLLLAKLLSVALFLQNPIELPIIRVAAALHEATVEASEVVVIGALLKIQIPAVLQVLAKLFRRVSRQLLNRGLDFLFLNAIVLVVLVLAS